LSYLNGRITDIVDPVGRRVTYAYDNNGRLATVLDSEGGVTRYTYDAQGRMLTLTDARGITYLTNEYDSAGRVSRQTQADGGTWLFAYTTSSGPITQTAVTDPRGKQTTTRFTGQVYSLDQTDGQGQTTTSIRNTATNQIAHDRLSWSHDHIRVRCEWQCDEDYRSALHETRFTYDDSSIASPSPTPEPRSPTTYDPANGNLTTKDPLNHVHESPITPSSTDFVKVPFPPSRRPPLPMTPMGTWSRRRIRWGMQRNGPTTR
jgi:YD repeat-containing protein